ncbi:TetR/AcrR family transcriptional regulator [Natrinema soli]|uniref:TetR/AcrR family transcriptional regulator n=1 Tax=Natrinema soli TaxID=1930624 RepID=A0ABD5SWY3_9EURY|nr:TetR/AcrR family transcriptional regulator [Natrinema soli]
MTTTQNELMEATYVALCKHGYASLRMQDIAAESSKSKGTLHYHYDSKQELLSAFLAYLYDSFVARIDALEADSPDERLRALIETVLSPRDEETEQEFRTALLEIKAQGPYDDEFRVQLEAFDRLLHDRLETTLLDGQERGTFRDDFDAEPIADFLVTVLNGAQTRHVAVGHPPEQTRVQLLDYVDRHLVAATDADATNGTDDADAAEERSP